jgi:hypothetical protein
MMLSEADGLGVTRSSDLLVEPAAMFDVFSIGTPTSTPVMEITYGAGRRLFQTTAVGLHWVLGTGDGLLVTTHR